MKKLLTVFFCAMLAACAPQKMRMVDAKDDVAFVTMYRAMKPAMLERYLVDKAGNWYAPLMGTGQDDVGTILLDRLSPRFCSTELNEAGARSFREMLMPYDKLTVGPVSATLRMQEYTVRLLLAAVTDWSGDGKDDWAAALAAGADTYVTGTMSYNTLLDAKAAGLNVIAAGHYYTEAPVMEVVAKTISGQFAGVEAVVSETPCEILTV